MCVASMPLAPCCLATFSVGRAAPLDKLTDSSPKLSVEVTFASLCWPHPQLLFCVDVPCQALEGTIFPAVSASKVLLPSGAKGVLARGSTSGVVQTPWCPLTVTVACLQGGGPSAANRTTGGPAAAKSEEDLLKQDVKDVGRDVFDVRGGVVLWLFPILYCRLYSHRR